MKYVILTTTLLMFLCTSFSARADVTIETVNAFLAAQTNVYKKGSAQSVEQFVAFMSDDIKDYHVAYQREFSGKDFYRKNMPSKAKALMSFERTVSQILMGTDVAVATFHDTTKEKKPDGRISRYSGRTLLVIEFNDEGLIKALRRYQD